jgi:hypothetical protein
MFDPIIELLAIKLYEHDHTPWPVQHETVGWLKLDHEDKEGYRALARTGKYPYDINQSSSYR